MTWPWCDSAPPEPPYVPPGWLPYYYDHNHLARSGLTASLGIFHILWLALKHRHEAVGLPFTLPDPGRVRSTPRARILLQDYTASMSALLATEKYVGECGEPVSGPVPAAEWPTSVPAFIALFPRLRYTLREVLQVDESVPIASTVRRGSVIGSWVVPRFLGCFRIRSVTLEDASEGVSMSGAVHCGAFAPVEARYLLTVPFHTPSDPPKTVHGGGSGPGSFSFDLSGVSAVPPVGYTSTPPPPNCDYRYLLQGSWTHAEVIINGRAYYFDGPGPHEVTEALGTSNTVTVRPWNGTPAWSALTLREIRQWTGSLPAPPTTVQRFRDLVWYGERPWGNQGGFQTVSFRLQGAVEAFRYGPFAPPLPESFLPPSLQVWPRHLDPGMTCHAGFLPPSETSFTYTALFRRAGATEPVPGGTVVSEITWKNFVPGQLAPTGRVEVTAGGNTLAASVIGPRSRICEILSYEPDQNEEEQPGIILTSVASLTVPPASPFSLWPVSAFTFYTRIRAADGHVFRCGAFDLSIAGGIPTANGATGPPLQPGRMADLALTYDGTNLVLTVNGVRGVPVPFSTTFGDQAVLGGGFPGRMYRAILYSGALSAQAVLDLSAHGSPDSRWTGTAFDLDLHVGTGLHIPDRTPNLSGGDATSGMTHIFPAPHGSRSVVRYASAADLSSPVPLATLLKHHAPVRVEFEILQDLTPGAVLKVGTAGDPDWLLSASDVSSGFHVHSLHQASAAGPVPLFLSATGMATGVLRIRFVYEVRGIS